MKINGNTYSNIVYYGGTPIVGNAYRVFVPFGNMSQAFTLIFEDTSPGESGVQSVNGKTGDVVLTANDVGAVSKTGDTMTGNLTVGSASLQTNGYVTGTWLRTTANTSLGSAASKIAVINDGWVYSRTPAQIKSDIGLGNVDNVKQYSESNPPPYPVTSVNGQTGDVTIEAGGTVDVDSELSSTSENPVQNKAVNAAISNLKSLVGDTSVSTQISSAASSTTPKAAGTASVGTETKFSRGDHIHPEQTDITGNAGTATKLQTARTIRTKLSSTSAVSFDGSANITPGITGTLAVSHGGTGATTAANACSKLGAVKKSGDTMTGSLGIGGDLTVSGKTNGLYIKAGTKVITTTESSQVAVFTSADLNTLFGTSGITWDNTNSVCFFSNGDWSAKSTPICAMFYSGKWRIITTDWSKFTSGASFRVNYIAIGWA